MPKRNDCHERRSKRSNTPADLEGRKFLGLRINDFNTKPFVNQIARYQTTPQGWFPSREFGRKFAVDFMSSIRVD